MEACIWTWRILSLYVVNRTVLVVNNGTELSYDFYVLAVPYTPTYFYVKRETITDTSAMLTWLPADNEGLPQSFQLRYRPCFGKSWGIRTLNETGKDHKERDVTLTGLQSGTKYGVELIAFNENGHSKSLNDTFRTLAAMSNGMSCVFFNANQF